MPFLKTDTFHSLLNTSRRHLRFIVIAVVLILLWPFTGNCESNLSPETQIQAQLIKRFVKYTRWPVSASDANESEVRLCVLKENEKFTEAFKELKNKTVRRRKLVLRNCTGTCSFKTCHILYVNSTDKKKVKKVLQSVPTGVLTMGVFKGFAQMGGIINCYRVRGKLRLEINIDAARRSGFEFSSDMLALARLIREPGNKSKKTQER